MDAQLAAIAEEIAATRRQMLALARNPGFTGISKKGGIESLDAVIEDIVRAVARKLVPERDASTYARFLEASKGA